jgi:hypothetical protein
MSWPACFQSKDCVIAVRKGIPMQPFGSEMLARERIRDFHVQADRWRLMHPAPPQGWILRRRASFVRLLAPADRTWARLRSAGHETLDRHFLWGNKMLGGIVPDATTLGGTTTPGLSTAVEWDNDTETNRPACVDLSTARLEHDVDRVSVELMAPAVCMAGEPPRPPAAAGAGRTGGDR